jgi:GH24 family phage-related lysozyme (muramidase)
MPSRRQIILGCLGLGLGSAAAQARADTFDTLYQEVLADPDLVQAAKAERDGQQVEYDLRTNRDFEAQVRAFAPRLKASHREISVNAQNLIILFEVTSAALYNRKFQTPVWPKGDSGVTIGIGYDLGYIRPEWLQEDWGHFLSAATLKALMPACGLRHGEADAYCKSHPDVVVSWSAAHAQFQQILLPRFIAETLIHLPQASCLSNDSLGALVSLVYNRGASFTTPGPRYLEMREIRTAALQADWQSVPGLIEGMQHLWADKPSLRGLMLRRRMEAAQFRSGLATNPCRG